MSEKLTDLKLYDIKEMSALLEVSTRTTMRYIADGKLKAVKIGGKWKCTEENLMAFVNGNQQSNNT